MPIRAAVTIGLTMTIIASWWFWHISHAWANAASVFCPGLAFTGMLLMGSDRVIERLQYWIDKNPLRIAVFPAGLWGLYLVYAFGMGIAGIRGAAVMAIYLAIPFIAFAAPRNPRARLWIEPAVILWLWLPLELGIIRSVLMNRSGSDLHYVLAQLLAIDAGIVAFTVWNRTAGTGLRFELDRKIVRVGFVSFMLFSLIAIPLGIAIEFIHYSFRASKLLPAPGSFVGIFFFTAFPEEFLFRGLIQNWFERLTQKPLFSLMISALIFGASHLNNGPPIPNYRYFLLAGIAGIFYGAAWLRTRSLMASSFTHALVDTCWSLFFR